MRTFPTRRQYDARLVAKLAANALGLPTPDLRHLTDTDSPYVEALCAAGIVGGYPDGPIARARPSPARRSPRS
ncbi:MAG: hypothetical protein ACLT1T_05520 [Oscillospiraceae bacterium]